MFAAIKQIDWELSQEDGVRVQPRITDGNTGSGIHPVQDTSMRGDMYMQPQATIQAPTAPYMQPHSMQSQSMQSQSSMLPPSLDASSSNPIGFDAPDRLMSSHLSLNQAAPQSGKNQAQPFSNPTYQPPTEQPANYNPALDPRSLDFLNAEIKRLEAMKAQMISMQSAHSSASIPSHGSPYHQAAHPRQPVQPPASLPPTGGHIIPQHLLPFSPTDENVYQSQIAHPVSQLSSVGPLHNPAAQHTWIKTAEPVEGSAISCHTNQSTLSNALPPSHVQGGAASHGPPTNPNPVQPEDTSTHITHGVRDMTLQDSSQAQQSSSSSVGGGSSRNPSMPGHLSSVSLDLSVSGGDVRT